MLDSYKIFKSLTKRINHFLLFAKLQQPSCISKIDDVIKHPKRNTYKKIKIARLFRQMSQVDYLRKNDKYKFAGRNVLGVR
jgi:hypothetical protein